MPVANFGAQISWPLILIGFFIGGGFLVDIGILLFSAAVLFQLVTLPVEYNASHRAVKLLDSIGILRDQEVGQARKVLGSCRVNLCAKPQPLPSFPAAASAYFIWKQRQG